MLAQNYSFLLQITSTCLLAYLVDIGEDSLTLVNDDDSVMKYN